MITVDKAYDKGWDIDFIKSLEKGEHLKVHSTTFKQLDLDLLSPLQRVSTKDSDLLSPLQRVN